MKRILSALVPRSLTGQLIVLLILSLVASQVVTIALFMDDRAAAARESYLDNVMRRIASAARLVEQTTSDQHPMLLRTLGRGPNRFIVTPDNPLSGDPAAKRQGRLEAQLKEILSEDGVAVSKVEAAALSRGSPVHRRFRHGHPRRARKKAWLHGSGPHPERPGSPGEPREGLGPGTPAMKSPEGGPQRRPPPFERRDMRPPEDLNPRKVILFAVQFESGEWLSNRILLVTPTPPAKTPLLIALALSSLAVIGVVIVMARRITKPLARLSAAAERLGRGDAVEPLPEDGPQDVSRATTAFNQMNERLSRFLQNQRQMLAAISHDLRTPLTSLKLRAEFVGDGENKERMLRTLDDMERMTRAVLAFTRGESGEEASRRVDLTALIESLCEDRRDLGEAVTFADENGAQGRTLYVCRPMAIKRALSNLIDNGLRYGARVTVSLKNDAGKGVRVLIDDEGPGIPDHQLEEVMRPFVRLETSRSRDTGGTGLGLAIAHSIVTGHGGELTLRNRESGGLRAEIHLPPSSQDVA